MAVWESEDTTPGAWERWIDALENFLGHDLDGNFRQDGYSLDGCWAMFLEGLTVRAAAARVNHDKQFAPYDGR